MPIRKEEPLPFPVLLDSTGKVSKKYGIRAHPDHFLINGKGNLLPGHWGEEIG
jgi:hypothetical protein